MDRLQEVGCIACRIRFGMGAPADVHHITEGGRRLGHDFTIPLCPWHHRGISAFPDRVATEKYGPSLAKSKREFVGEFGTEKTLLHRVNVLLAASKYMPI